MLGLCILVPFLLLLFVGTVTGIIAYLARAKSSAPRRALISLVIGTPLSFAVVVACVGAAILFRFDRPLREPAVADMVGHYVSGDRRAPGATLDLRPDGTYELAGWPSSSMGWGQPSPRGRWDVRGKRGDCRLSLENISGFEVYGFRPPYEIGLFIGDPDEGAIVFRH